MRACNAIDLTGQKFGKLTIIRDSGKRQHDGKRIVWECKCDCGNKYYSTSDNLKFKKNPGCGCGRHKKSYNNKFIGEISGVYWSHILSHAKDRKIEVMILFLTQKKKLFPEILATIFFNNCCKYCQSL